MHYESVRMYFLLFMYMLCHVKMIDSIMCNPESTVFVKN